MPCDHRWKMETARLPLALFGPLSLRTQNGKKKRIQSLSLSLSPHLFSPSSPSSSSSTGIPVTHSGHAQVERPPRRMKREREKKLSRTRVKEEEKDFSSFSNFTKRRHCTVCFQRGRRCPSVRQTAVITDTLRPSTGRIPPHRITARDSARPATQSTSVWRIRQMGRKRDEEKNRKIGFSLTCKCVDFGV